MDINAEFLAAVKAKANQVDLTEIDRIVLVNSGSASEPPAKSAVDGAIAAIKLQVLQDWIEAGKSLKDLDVTQELDYWEALQLLKV